MVACRQFDSGTNDMAFGGLAQTISFRRLTISAVAWRGVASLA